MFKIINKLFSIYYVNKFIESFHEFRNLLLKFRAHEINFHKQNKIYKKIINKLKTYQNLRYHLEICL
jgi:hypothetical protein